MNTCPPTVIVALRLAQLPELSLTVKLTVPFPVLLLVVCNQFVLLAALHAQPANVVTPTLPLPAVAATFVLAAANAYVHAAAAWLTVNACPFTVIVPLRTVPAGFAVNV